YGPSVVVVHPEHRAPTLPPTQSRAHPHQRLVLGARNRRTRLALRTGHVVQTDRPEMRVAVHVLLDTRRRNRPVLPHRPEHCRIATTRPIHVTLRPEPH